MHPDLLQLADHQGGAFTREQALSFHHERVLRRWYRDQVIDRIGAGVYAVVPVSTKVADRLRQAELITGENLIVCGSTAAAYFGFGQLNNDELHVTTESGRSLHGSKWLITHQCIPRSRPIVVDGVQMTSAGHTAIDIACAAPKNDTLAVLDQARRAGVSMSQLTIAAQLAEGRRGILNCRRLLSVSTPLSESWMESRSRQRIVDGGLPAPEPQIEVMTDSGPRRIDMGYRERKVGVEYDGEDFHSGDGSLCRDRRRHNSLIAAGWTILYLTASDVYSPRPTFLDTLRQLLGKPFDHAVLAGVSGEHAVPQPELPGLSA